MMPQNLTADKPKKKTKKRRRQLYPLALDAKGLAPVLSLSVRTLRVMDAAGKLPRPIRLNGTRVVWIVREIREWLDAGSPDREEWEQIKASRKAGKR